MFTNLMFVNNTTGLSTFYVLLSCMGKCGIDFTVHHYTTTGNWCNGYGK